MVNVSCPHCGESVNVQARFCEYCGADLALAAVLAERAMASPLGIPDGVVISPEMLVPRIGDYLIEKGLLRQADLQKALAYQHEQSNRGRSILIGQALLEMKLVSRETLDQAVTVQILQLQAALNTANRQLEQRVRERTKDLQQALERLSELNQLKSNFIANISHELRTPLTHLKGYLDIVSSENLGSLNEAQAEALKVMVRAEERLERLIEDLIQFSLASRGELTMNVGPMQLLKTLQKILASAEQRAQAAGVTLASRLAERLPILYADEEKIAWVVGQLVDNGLKFTNRGGRVELEARQVGDKIIVAVTDTGIGIPPERVNEIFEPFHQLDSSATRRFGGTGLGLAMAARIIEAHDSKIQVKSVPGRGSRFEFSLSTIKTPASVPAFE